MEPSLPKNHEVHTAGKRKTSMTHYLVVHTFIPMPQAMKILDAEAAVDKEWKKLETIPTRQLEKVKSKKEVILEAQRDKKKVHFATLMDICQVFTEQGSSASQMIAAKNHARYCKIIELCCSICLHSGKIGGCSKIAQNSKIGMPKIFGYVFHDTYGQNGGPVLKTPSFLFSEICTIILWQDCYAKGNLRKSPIENAYSFTVKKDYSYLCMWMTSNWLERNKTLIRCGNYSTKKLIWENQHLSWITKNWAALNDNAK